MPRWFLPRDDPAAVVCLRDFIAVWRDGRQKFLEHFVDGEIDLLVEGLEFGVPIFAVLERLGLRLAYLALDFGQLLLGVAAMREESGRVHFLLADAPSCIALLLLFLSLKQVVAESL